MADNVLNNLTTDDALELEDVDGVCRFLKIGKTKAYELMASGALEVVRVGGGVRATRRGLRTYVIKQAAKYRKLLARGAS